MALCNLGFPICSSYIQQICSSLAYTDRMQPFEACITGISICSHLGWHYGCSVTSVTSQWMRNSRENFLLLRNARYRAMIKPVVSPSGVRRNFSWGGFIQWHMVVICIWCAVFVTSRFDVIFTFPNQQFGEVRWQYRHILLHTLPCLMCHYTDKLSALQVRILEENTINATTPVHNCKNIRLRVETGE